MKLVQLNLAIILYFLPLSILWLPAESVVIKIENLPERCGLQTCSKPDPNKLNVHLVPHTHDDVGWLKTVEQYYYGSNNRHQKAGVQYILDSVVQELIQNKDRKFIYVETAFFWKWWQEQDKDTQAIVKELVKTGQLEFINGGWSMPDEAGTHYNSLIDQATWGHRRLKDLFGKCGVPRVTWQIDPFGHSRELASLYAQMNFDAVYFARQDYQDKSVRGQNKTLEHVWQGSDDLGKAGDIFTGMMYMGYGPPHQLNWDMVGGSDEPVIDNRASEEYNVPRIVATVTELAKEYATHYATNHVMYPMGTDFQYMDAHIYFKNMDKLIKAVNANSTDVHFLYSTPSCYTKALHDTGKTFTTKTDDFFPYASDPHAYWTGYFTSRPALKRFERVGNNLLQACKQLDALANNDDSATDERVNQMREIMGVMQHHDAVAGTEKQHVSDNYAKQLQIGLEGCRQVITTSYQKLVSKSKPESKLEQTFCDYLNISSCAITESGQNLAVNIYNPLAHELTGKPIRLPVQINGHYFEVTNPDSKSVASSLIPIPEFVQKIPGRSGNAQHELVFKADLPALGLATYFVKVTTAKTANSAVEVKGTKITEQTKLKAKKGTLVLDKTGQPIQFVLDDGAKVVALGNSFEFYKGKDGDNREFTKRASGAYIFRPDGQNVSRAGKLVESTLYVTADGSQEVHQTYDSYLQQVIRVCPEHEVIQFEWVVGPIPVQDNVGKEIVARFTTDLKNDNTFYTDANGRQMLKREWNHRPTWRLKVEEPISGNYYPVNSRIFLRDTNKKIQMTVLNDRSQGGTSPEAGTIELMVHRRLLHDDAFGVGEALNEPGEDGKGLVIRGSHLLLIDTVDQSATVHRPVGQHLFLEPIVSFVRSDESSYVKQFATRYSGLEGKLPPNVHLLTLEQWSGDDVLLRLEHFFQKSEDPQNLGKSVQVDLSTLFHNASIESIDELTLSANQPIAALNERLTFKYSGSKKTSQISPTKLDASKIELSPSQIRTFVIKLKSK